MAVLSVGRYVHINTTCKKPIDRPRPAPLARSESVCLPPLQLEIETGDGTGLELYLAASLLQLRGDAAVASVPFVHPTSGDVLCFNGEVFGGLDVGPGCNDGEALLQALTVTEGEGWAGPWARREGRCAAQSKGTWDGQARCKGGTAVRGARPEAFDLLSSMQPCARSFFCPLLYASGCVWACCAFDLLSSMQPCARSFFCPLLYARPQGRRRAAPAVALAAAVPNPVALCTSARRRSADAAALPTAVLQTCHAC
eukprot:359434-Chlamydomonas_euryale.AAC.2